jgi:hypothetical protein
MSIIDDSTLKNADEDAAEELEKIKNEARQAEKKRKILYAENELSMIKNDARRESLKIFISFCKRYNVSSDDINMILEISQYL